MEKQSTWSTTGRLDRDGDPIFLSPDATLWAISRRVGSLQQILERLDAGPKIPWSDMEKIGHEDDWIVSIRLAQGAAGSWPEAFVWIDEQMKPLGEDVDYHDWERAEQSLFRPRLDEERARQLEQALQGNQDIEVIVQPILSHLERGE